MIKQKMSKEEYKRSIERIDNEINHIRREKVSELNSEYAEANKEFKKGDTIKVGNKMLKMIKVSYQQWSEAIPPTIMYCGVALDESFNVKSWSDEIYFRHGEKLERKK